MDMPEIKRYLAWDTSSLTGAVAAFEVRDGKCRLVAEWSLSLETSKHSERLLWTVDVVLQSAGWKLEEIHAIAVGVGPGSFTGLRIGLTTAKMLASQLQIPLLPISSLVLLARPVVERVLQTPKQEKTLVIACTDASKGEWFTLIGPAKAMQNCLIMAEGDERGIWSRGVVEKTLSPNEVIEEAKAYLKKAGPSARWVAVGQSVDRYEADFKKLPTQKKIIWNEPFLHQLQPRVLAQLAFETLQQGIERNSSGIKPRYLRDSDAEVKLRNGTLKAAPMLHRTGVA